MDELERLDKRLVSASIRESEARIAWQTTRNRDTYKAWLIAALTAIRAEDAYLKAASDA